MTNNTKEAQDVQMLYSSFVSVSQNTGDTTEDLTYGIVNDSPIKDRIDMLNKKLILAQLSKQHTLMNLLMKQNL